MNYSTKNFTLLFILLSVLLIGMSSFSKRKSDLGKFKIKFENTESGLKLYGLKGTAFRELSFEMTENDKKEIDEFGMVMNETTKTDKKIKDADFEFTIQRVNGEYVLLGNKGTAWLRLSFTFSQNNKVVINQNGVIVK